MKALAIPLIALIAAPSWAAAQTTDEIVERVQKVYQDTRNFRADFSQKLTLRATKRKRRAGGRVYFQKPYRFRFVYTRGEDKKVVVSDGKKVWTYMLDERQVRIDPFSPKLANSVRFLWGEGNLREQFEIRRHEGKEYGRPGDPLLELVPKADEGYYKKLIFVIDPATFEVRETVVFDPVGNVNHMAFANVKRNVEMAAKLFRFKTPKGAQVVRSPELKDDD
jgi:outer membrane lipoprotein carrier protein